VFIRGLWKLFYREKIPENFWQSLGAREGFMLTRKRLIQIIEIAALMMAVIAGWYLTVRLASPWNAVRLVKLDHVQSSDHPGRAKELRGHRGGTENRGVPPPRVSCPLRLKTDSDHKIRQNQKHFNLKF